MFILTLGFFVTPAVLGGNRVPMISTVLDNTDENVHFGLADWQDCTLKRAAARDAGSVRRVQDAFQRGIFAAEDLKR